MATSKLTPTGSWPAGASHSSEPDRFTPQTSLEERLERIESILLSLVQQQTVREWYSTDQVAQILGKSEFTVREWARLRRIVASKRRSGRGAHASWVISHAELMRLQREGLLPIPR